ncbi:TPA: protein translocase subunit SecF [Candidatus Daviesbacteria bacterium]|nr:MAG: protein-export membrane protein SecF [Candidatus Daviesbacteria bacterium RIFCSPHIGHO2_01_FULL_38_8b]OGE73195.1 MAG: protein-export membrane protein SecF [Candidatus Daviesbacteria bacterium RIFCSPLOWO2_12_FULL_38_10]HBQ51168.1 protein translocase subunit SecF [Candidatus Daviesbacteria bacterium]
MNLMKYKLWYFLFSLALIIPGSYVLLTSGLKLGIDFTGGSLLEYRFEKQIALDDLKQYGQITPTLSNTYIIRSQPKTKEEVGKIKKELETKFGKIEERRQEFVGPVIGRELSQKAFYALTIASLAIVLYIAFSFRKIPKPASPWRFGICAIVALLHDVLLVIGVFALLGKFLGVEVDTLFVTAILTIIGFSVHDTIVVFDRIRENSLKNIGKKFTAVANLAVVQTLGRSLNTSLTVVFVLVALLLFGGETIKWFTVALLVGIISGTYSSIFNATALLVWWEERLGH